MQLKDLIFLGSMLLVSSTIASQDPLFFKSYALDRGLSQNTVNTICQDQQGFMWFGTNDGLNKFDGQDFTVYRADPSDIYSLRSNAIFRLMVDSRDNLWIGTRGGGLHRYDERMDRFIYYDLNLNFNVIRCIYEDSEHHLWVGTNSGLFQVDRENMTYMKFDHNNHDPFSLAHNTVNAIAEDPCGNLWIGTRESGLERFNRRSGTFTHFGPDSENNERVPVEYISDLYADPSGILWIASEREGLARYDIRTEELVKYPILLERFDPEGLSHFHVMDLYSANGTVIWIATLGGGLSMLDVPGGHFSHYHHLEDLDGSISKNSVNAIFIDRWGNLWVGTEGAGLNFHDAHRKKFGHHHDNPTDVNSLSANSVLSFCEAAPGKFWIGTDEGGLNFFDSQKGSFVHYYLNDPEIPGGQSGNVVTSVLVDPDRKVWIGTFSGLYCYDGKEFKLFFHDPEDPSSLSSSDVYSLLLDSMNRFWVGTNGGGLNLIDRKTGKTLRYQNDENDHRSISNNYITDMLEDSRGNIWIGTWEGLNRLDDGGGPFIHYFNDTRDSTSISSNEITVMLEDSKQRVWIGTYGGLNLFDPAMDGFIHYTEASGLANNVICGILEDGNGWLWISSFNGITRFHPETMEARNFYVDDGLQGNQFNVKACAKSVTGELLFGGIHGFNYFHPDSIHVNPVPPPVVLTGFRLYNRRVKPGEKDAPLDQSIWETEHLMLKYFQSTFSFEFVALNFSSSENCEYRYMLENFDKDWIENGALRMANYTNIPPGKYTFRVMASNNDGVWNSGGISLDIIINPPYWATWWFRIIIVTLMLSLVLAAHYLRVYSIKRQKKFLEQEVEIRTREVVEQKKEIEKQAESLKQANQEIIAKNLTLEFQKEEIESQAGEIRRMNVLLRSRNINLTKNVKEKSLALVMQKRVSFDEFCEIYPDDKACFDFIRELKSSAEFECINCHHHEYYEMTGQYFRRCKKCGYRESITANTIFHRLKFPIVKAFYILHLVSTGRELTVDELSSLISLRRETCWAFRNKVMDVMSTRKRFKNPREGWKELILLPEKYKRIHH